jgi:hypothetical protein
MGRRLLRAADGDIRAVGAADTEEEEDLSPLWLDRE